MRRALRTFNDAITPTRALSLQVDQGQTRAELASGSDSKISILVGIGRRRLRYACSHSLARADTSRQRIAQPDHVHDGPVVPLEVRALGPVRLDDSDLPATLLHGDDFPGLVLRIDRLIPLAGDLHGHGPASKRDAGFEHANRGGDDLEHRLGVLPIGAAQWRDIQFRARRRARTARRQPARRAGREAPRPSPGSHPTRDRA